MDSSRAHQMIAGANEASALLRLSTGRRQVLSRKISIITQAKDHDRARLLALPNADGQSYGR